jgi:tripartite-type tricarboxylate transporter receptor subunit TctC
MLPKASGGTTMKRLFATVLVLLAGAAAAAADTYPSRTVKLLCWTTAGAPLDVMMRQLGKQLAEIFGQSVVVENRAGGSGVAAMASLMNQPADGYNLLSTTSSMSFTMATGRIAFGPQNFIVLPAIQAEPSAVAVRADSRFKTLRQLVEHLRDHPDTLTVGGFSAAGFHQFVFYRLQQEAKFKADWIPFKGGQEAGLALLGGHIDVAVITPSSALAQIQNGDLRLLAISSAQRDEYFPDIPTFKEQGFDVVETIWRGVMVKAGTPQGVIDVLTAAIEKVKQTREWKEFSRVNLQSSLNISLEDMRKLVAGEISSDRAFLESGGFLKRMN